MKSILAKCSASISELKKNPTALIEQSEGEPIAILNHNCPTAYLIPAETYENMLKKLEKLELCLLIKKRQNDKQSAVDMPIDELYKVNKSGERL